MCRHEAVGPLFITLRRTVRSEKCGLIISGKFDDLSQGWDSRVRVSEGPDACFGKLYRVFRTIVEEGRKFHRLNCSMVARLEWVCRNNLLQTAKGTLDAVGCLERIFL